MQSLVRYYLISNNYFCYKFLLFLTLLFGTSNTNTFRKNNLLLKNPTTKHDLSIFRDGISVFENRLVCEYVGLKNINAQ